MAKWEWQRKRQGERPVRRHQDRRIARSHDRAPRRDAGDAVVLYGWHTVTAALQNPARRLNPLFVPANPPPRPADEAIAPAVTPEVTRPDALAARLTPDAVHQGLIAEADPLPSPAIEELPDSGIVLV